MSCSGAPERYKRITSSLMSTTLWTASTSLVFVLYGHKKNAYWYGSQLSIDETRALAPYQERDRDAVTSVRARGMVWALENPTAGIVEADEMDCPSLPRSAAGLIIDFR